MYPREIVVNTMQYRKSETVQSSGDFLSKQCQKITFERQNVCKDKVLLQDNSIARLNHFRHLTKNYEAVKFIN